VEEQRTPDEAVQLRRLVEALEEEVAILRRRATGAPERVRELETELGRTRDRLERATAQNDKLAAVLEEARQQLGVLREEVDKLTAPPNNFGTVLQVNVDGSVDVVTGNRKLRVSAQPSIEVKQLQVGQEILLNEAFNIIDVREFEQSGEVLRIREILDDHRVVVIARADDESVIGRSDAM
jgi:proteasome-associated ATPase